MDQERERGLAEIAAENELGHVLRMVPLGSSRVPLRLDPCGRLAYVALSTGEALSLSDANDEVGLVVMLHPDRGEGDSLPCRYRWYDGVEVVEVETSDGLLLVPSGLVPYDERGGATVGNARDPAPGLPTSSRRAYR